MMWQEELLKILEEKKDWMIIGEIMETLHEGRVQINHELRGLLREGKIMKKRIITRKGGTNIWKAKER